MIAFFHGLIGSAAHWNAVRSHLPPAIRMDCFAPEIDYSAQSLDAVEAEMRIQIRNRAPRRVVVCGHSIGCMLALRLHDVADEVILAAPPFDDDYTVLPLGLGSVEATVDSLVRNPDTVAGHAYHRAVARYKLEQLVGSRDGIAAIRRLKADCQTFLDDPRLVAAQDKISVALGGQDASTPEGPVRAFLRERAPNIRAYVIPETGHTLPLEAPRPLARMLIRAHGSVSPLTCPPRPLSYAP